jgi:hypothetical protein
MSFFRDEPSDQPNTDEPAKFDFIAFLSIAQQAGLDFLPITWHRGLDILGEGATTEVNQSVVNINNSFAFKRKPGQTNKTDAELINALCTEILILCHPPVRDDPNILDVVGISWQCDIKCSEAWPSLVFPKAEFGSLDSFLRSAKGQECTVHEKLGLCSAILNAAATLHACGKSDRPVSLMQ